MIPEHINQGLDYTKISRASGKNYVTQINRAVADFFCRLFHSSSFFSAFQMLSIQSDIMSLILRS